jgi:hypothetical protein
MYSLRELKNLNLRASDPLEHGGMPAPPDMRHHSHFNQKPVSFLRRSYDEPHGAAVAPGSQDAL